MIRPAPVAQNRPAQTSGPFEKKNVTVLVKKQPLKLVAGDQYKIRGTFASAGITNEYYYRGHKKDPSPYNERGAIQYWFSDTVKGSFTTHINDTPLSLSRILGRLTPAPAKKTGAFSNAAMAAAHPGLL
jgi:hypothetical protein